tara:strand:+ start:1016 stop:2044 length:1029 start_codon:yes stop_codon:yes gene_type:complete
MKNNSSVLIIFTGGTIGMIKKENQYVAIKFKDLISHFPELRKLNCYLEIVSFNPSIDSANIDENIWIKIVDVIEKNYTKFDGFVILHGTDTMAYSASAVSFMFQNLNKPIIFTGSQLPIGVHRTDAKENLITSIEIAGKRDFGKAVVPEVCIYFEYKLLRGNRAHKCNSNDFNAFSSYNYPALAKAGIDIDFNYNYIRNSATKPLKVYKEIKNNVGVIKLFPGISKEYVKNVLSNMYFDAIILETYGCGNSLNADWLKKELKHFIEKGKIVINTSQCEAGSVNQTRYETGRFLEKLGVISAGDMTFESTLTKTMLLLHDYPKRIHFKQKFLEPFCGEITKSN